jgi:hypothetical protein
VTLPAGNYCNVNFNSQTTINLGPGTYSNINFNGSPTINLSPGHYVIKNTMTVSSGAKFSGTGVTFYFADSSSKIQFNGNTNIVLSAPTSGTYSDILFYEPDGLGLSQWVINGSGSSTLNGLIHLPSRNVTINSVNNATMDHVTMVFDTLILNGMNWTFQTSPKVMTVTTGAQGKVAYLAN